MVSFRSIETCQTSNLDSSPFWFSTIAPSFVPRSHGVVAPLSKNVLASHVYGSRTKRATSGAASVTMMPIGVPKVAYRVPGSQQADWYVFLGLPIPAFLTRTNYSLAPSFTFIHSSTTCLHNWIFFGSLTHFQGRYLQSIVPRTHHLFGIRN